MEIVKNVGDRCGICKGKSSGFRDRYLRAGVGGLMLAARLAQMGRKPILFEARSETATTSEGVFLTLAPNGMNGLRTIGCDEEVKVSGIATTGIEIRNAKAKRLAFAAQSDHEAGFGAPSVTVRRGRLAEILLAKARAAGVDTRFDAQVSDVTTSPDGVGVRLQFKDGITHDFGILVAADGLGSTVHNVVFQGYPKPHFTGLIGTGGITNAPVPDTGGIMRMTFGNNAFFGYLKAEGRPVYWFNSYTLGPAKTEKSPIPPAMHRRSERCIWTTRAPTTRSSNTSTGSSAAIRSTTCRSSLVGTKAGLC